jgi:hypothetical protein
MRKTLSVVMLTIALSAFVSSCGGEGFPRTQSSEWVTISGRDVSLSLPSFFQGGDPADPEVISVLQRMAESRSNPRERESLTQWLDSMGMSWASGPSLMAWAAPDDGGPIASVTVGWAPLKNLLAVSDGDSSMRALVDAYMLGATGWKLDSLKAREATVIFHYDQLTDNASAGFIVIKVVGDLYYFISYECSEESWDALSDTFRESAETLR